MEKWRHVITELLPFKWNTAAKIVPSGFPYHLVCFRCTRKSPKISILGGQWHDVQNSSTQIDNKEQCANSLTKGAILVYWAREEVSRRFYRKLQLLMYHLHLLWAQNQDLDAEILGLFTSSKVRWRKRRMLCVEKTCSISWENRRHFPVTSVQLLLRRLRRTLIHSFYALISSVFLQKQV